MKLRILSILLILLAVAALAADPATRNPIPDPALVIDSDSYVIAVFEMRDNDDAVKQLLDVAWTSLTEGGGKLPAQFADVNNYISGQKAKDVVYGALPVQAVRVDRVLPSGQTSPTYAATMSGWRGLQVQLYNSLAKGPNGAFPSETYKRTDLVARTGANDPTQAGTLARVNGTFLFAPTPAVAKAVYDRMSADKPVPAKGALATAYAGIDKSGDAFGVAINNKDTFKNLLKTFEGPDLQAIRNKIGADRMDKIVVNTKTIVWSGNIVDANSATGTVVLTMNPAAVADTVAALNEGKGSVDPTRLTSFNVASAADKVTVTFTVAGIKQMLLDALTKG